MITYPKSNPTAAPTVSPYISPEPTISVTPSEISTPIRYVAGAKLTIVDDNHKDFSVEEDIIRGTRGSSISIHYSGAKRQSQEETAEGSSTVTGYISAIIKDTYGNPLYHTRRKPVGENSSGTVSMYIPSDIDFGEYTLVVYNEVERGAYNTNYAGYDTLVLVVCDEEEKPTVTNVYTNAAGTKFKFTASDNWDLYQVTNSGGSKLRDLANSNVTTNMLCGNQSSISIEDLAGNVTTVQEQNILVDRMPPDVNITYSNGKYILTVSDNESGVWKITNSDGSTIYHDYSTSDSSATT